MPRPDMSLGRVAQANRRIRFWRVPHASTLRVASALRLDFGHFAPKQRSLRIPDKPLRTF